MIISDICLLKQTSNISIAVYLILCVVTTATLWLGNVVTSAKTSVYADASFCNCVALNK